MFGIYGRIQAVRRKITTKLSGAPFQCLEQATSQETLEMHVRVRCSGC